MRWVLVLCLIGCGRIGFDATTDGRAAVDDGRPQQQSDAGAVTGSPSFVTSAEGSSPSSAAISVDVAGVQTGDTLIVSIGWRSGTSQVVSVSDTNGNPYASQGAVTRSNNMVSQQMFTATASLALAPTTITVSMSLIAPQLSVRVLVYRGVAIVGSGSAQAQTATATTPVSPQTAGAIVVGSNTALAGSIAPCSGCTTRMTTTYGDLVVEKVFTTAGGIQSISIGLDAAAPWVMGQVELDP